MVFTPPTFIDYENASLLAFERQKLAAFNHHLKIAPHIASHIHVQIGLYKGVSIETQEQFDHAIYVRLVGSEKFCSQVKCFSYYPRGQTCNRDQDPIVFKSGNSDIEACHSACFNLYEGAKDEEGNYFKAPLTHYSKPQQCCMIHNDVYFRLGIDDYMRTNAHTTPRVDTIGTGFDLSDDMLIDDNGNEAFNFRMNKYYCDDFKYEFKNGKCQPSVGETIFGTLVSSNLYKGIQYSQREGGVSGVGKPSLPPVTKQRPPNFTEWKSVVNPNAHFFNLNITLRMLGITRELSHLYFTTEFGWPGRLVEPLLLYTEIKCQDAIHINFSVENNRLPQFKLLVDGRRQFDEYELIGSYESLRRANMLAHEHLKEDEIISPNAVAQILTNLGATFATPEFWAAVAASFTDFYISMLKRIATFSQLHFERMTASLILISQKTIFNNIITKAGALTLKFSAVAFKLLASTFKMLSVVGTIVNILSLVDLFLLGTDLFNLNNLVGQDYIDNAFNIPDLTTNKQVYGYKSVEFSPAYFFAMYDASVKDDTEGTNLPESDNLKLLQPQSVQYSIDSSQVFKKNSILNNFLWEAQYLERLTKNSDGVSINWHESSGKTFHEFNDMVDNYKDTPHTFAGYQLYSSDIITRVGIVTYATIASISCALLGAIIKNSIFVFLSLFIGVMAFSVTLAPNIIRDLKETQARNSNFG